MEKIHQIEKRSIPSTGEDLITSPPLSAEQFGLAVGRILHRMGITELRVIKNGVEVGRLRLSTGTGMGVTMTAIAWEPIDDLEIEQTIHDADRHDFTIRSGVYGSWDSAGLARLDANRTEILSSLAQSISMTGPVTTAIQEKSNHAN